MKKFLSIFLSVLLIMVIAAPAFAAEKTVEPVASGYAAYDKDAVAKGDYDGLSYDQIASLIFDFLDEKIADATADFNSFEAEVYGQTVQIPLEITGIDSLLQYKDHLAELGGDFAELDASALDKTRADGDINLMYSFLEFMSDNSDVLGKVFAWTEENRFDYGKVGEYIEALDESDENNKAIKDFYHDYLLGNDIQSKFVSEIAEEMAYTPADGEDFDTVINNGILNKAASLCEGFLSAEAIETLKSFDLKTTDIYSLIKDFCTLVQNDKWEEITMYYTYILDNLVRPVLKVTFGYTAVIGESAAVPAEFNEIYTDLAALEKLSGGKVLFRANDGAYYEISVVNGAVTGANEVSYEESFLNFEAPEVVIADKGSFRAVYTPTSPDITSYAPTVYTDASYAELIDEDMIAAAGEFGITVKAEDIPEEIAAIIAENEGITMQNAFVMSVGAPIDTSLEIAFTDIEELANTEIEKKLPDIQTNIVDPVVAAAVNAANTLKTNMGSLGSFLPDFTGSVTLNSVTVELAYTGYQTEDAFICEVSAEPTYDITYGGNIWDYAQYAGITKEKIESDYIAPAVEEAVKNPAATVSVTNLNGSMDGIGDVLALMNFIDTDFRIDYDILDFAANYDDYNGVIGQLNRVLCGALEMLLSDEGYSSLELADNGNENLTDNLEKLCAKADSLISLAKDYMNEADFAGFTAGLSDLFASSHGFNANMIYNMDFSSVENLYVCALRLGCDMFVKDNSGILYDIHEIIEDLDTLDSMLVGITEYALAKIIDKTNTEIDGFDYKFTPKTAAQLKAIDTVKKTDPAKDEILTDLVDLAFYAAEFAAPVINDAVNRLIDNLNGENGDLPHVCFELGVKKGANWEETLTALTDRALDLLGGLLICADEASSKTNVLDKRYIVKKKVMPIKYHLYRNTDIPQAVKYIFHDACAGDLEGVLSYFEVKDDDIAGNVSATKALINASDYIVDAFFPDTVESELYESSETVQEEFTGELSDIGIASRNMQAVNTRKANLLACVFDLLKESKTILPYLAGAKFCKEHSFGAWETVTKATCTAAGTEQRICTVCGAAETRTVNATGHSYGAWTVKYEPTCINDGMKVSVCANCGDEKTEAVSATGNHTDNNGDEKCDTCGKDLAQKQSFFAKIANFFRKIFNWFKNLFG